MPVSISNQQDKVCLSPELEKVINRVVNIALEVEAVDPGLETAVVITDDEAIRLLNRDYRNMDRPTDVLSFAYREDSEEEPDYIDPEVEDDVLGDIIISLERASRQAEEYGHSLERELGFLVAHGMYHLLGYDHREPEEEAVMLARVEKVLAMAGLVR